MGESEVKVIYTIPMPPDSLPTETMGVLPFIQNGSPSRIRTYDLAVTVIPEFPQGLDYLFTISPLGLRCRALMRLIGGDPHPLVSARSYLLISPSIGFAQGYPEGLH